MDTSNSLFKNPETLQYVAFEEENFEYNDAFLTCIMLNTIFSSHLDCVFVPFHGGTYTVIKKYNLTLESSPDIFGVDTLINKYLKPIIAFENLEFITDNEVKLKSLREIFIEPIFDYLINIRPLHTKFTLLLGRYYTNVYFPTLREFKEEADKVLRLNSTYNIDHLKARTYGLRIKGLSPFRNLALVHYGIEGNKEVYFSDKKTDVVKPEVTVNSHNSSIETLKLNE